MVTPLNATLFALVALQSGYILASWKSKQINVDEVEKFNKARSSNEALSQDVEDA